MEWQQWFVLSWMQFATSSLIILLIANLVLRWISQPIEKVRLIQWMLVALVATPFLFAVPILPSRVFSLGSLLSSSIDMAANPKIEDATKGAGNSFNRIVETELASDRTQRNFVEFNEDASVAIAKPLNQPAVVETHVGTITPFPSTIISNESPAVAYDFWWLASVALVTVHFLAVICFWIHHRFGTSRLKQILMESTVASESLRCRWNKITNGRGKNVRLYLSTEVETPLTYGWRNPIVVLPVELASGGETDLDACLAHEWSHIEGGDALVWFWMNLAQYFIWYQPLYWNMQKELRICLELIADHKAVNSVSSPIAYSELLLRLAKCQRNLLPKTALTMSGRSSQLARRVRALLDTEALLRSRCRSSFSVMVVMGFLLLSIFTSMFRFTTSDASEPSNHTEADDSKKSKRIASFTRTVEKKTIDKLQRFKECVSEDGSQRWDSGDMNTTTICDHSGSKRIMLLHDSKIAFSFVPVHEFGSTTLTWQNLHRLKHGRGFANEHLGAKEINGKHAVGFKIEQFERTYTVWTDNTDGELVQVEYINPENEQVTLSEFDFSDSTDDALFDCTIPTGYKVHKNAQRRTSSLFGWALRKSEPVGMSLEWSRPDLFARYIESNSDGTSLYVLVAKQMDVIDPANHRILTFPVNADMVTTADLDGDGTREFVAVKNTLQRNDKNWMESKYRWSASAFSELGIPMWTYASEVDESKGFFDSIIRRISATDLNGDGRDEVILECGVRGFYGDQILDSEGKLKPIPESGRGVRSWDTGDLVGDSSSEFVSINRNGNLWLGDEIGKETQQIETGLYNHSVHIWKSKSQPGPNDGNFVVMGDPRTIYGRSKMGSFDTKGNQQWTVDLNPYVSFVFPCPNKEWIAISNLGGSISGSITVIDASSGKVIAQKRNETGPGQVAWLKAADGEPLLVLGSFDKIEAYRIAHESR